MDKRTILKFVGGDRDGEVLDSINDKGPSPEVRGTVDCLLGGGQIGKAFMGLSQAARMHLKTHGVEKGNPGFQPHVYKVAARDETDDLLTITLSFAGHDPKNPT